MAGGVEPEGLLLLWRRSRERAARRAYLALWSTNIYIYIYIYIYTYIYIYIYIYIYDNDNDNDNDNNNDDINSHTNPKTSVMTMRIRSARARARRQHRRAWAASLAGLRAAQALGRLLVCLPNYYDLRLLYYSMLYHTTLYYD